MYTFPKPVNQKVYFEDLPMYLEYFKTRFSAKQNLRRPYKLLSETCEPKLIELMLTCSHTTYSQGEKRHYPSKNENVSYFSVRVLIWKYGNLPNFNYFATL